MNDPRDLPRLLAQYKDSLIDARGQRDVLELAIADTVHNLRVSAKAGGLTPAQCHTTVAMPEGVLVAVGASPALTEPAPATSTLAQEQGRAGSTGAGSLETA